MNEWEKKKEEKELAEGSSVDVASAQTQGNYLANEFSIAKNLPGLAGLPDFLHENSRSLNLVQPGLLDVQKAAQNIVAMIRADAFAASREERE